MVIDTFADWIQQHGVLRALMYVGARNGEPQALLSLDPEVRANPYPLYARMREQAPLYRGRTGLSATTHAAASSVLRDDSFKVGLHNAAVPLFSRRRRSARGSRPILGPLQPPSMLALNGAEHTRYRRLVSSVFTPRAVAALDERITEVAHELLDGLADAGVVNLAEAYAGLLPVTVVAEVLGVPVEMRERFLRWGTMASPSLDLGLSWREHRQVEEGLRRINEWMYERIDQLRREPGDDMLSGLVHAQVDGAGLSDTELVATAGLLLAAGFETTVNLLGTGIRLLLEHPEQREQLTADPSLWGNAIEEMLRWDAPVQRTARFAGADTELAGQPVRAGTLMVVLIASANHDPAVFEDPERFDITRANAREHLSFSAGAHYCIGAALARAEGRIGLQVLSERFPAMRLAGRPQLRPTRTLRGYQALPVQLNPPTPSLV